MAKKERRKFWEEAIQAQLGRLYTPVDWYPFPALISFGLLIMLLGQILPGLNPRLGALATTISLDAPTQDEGAIWFSLHPEGDDLIIHTSDRTRYTWPLGSRNMKDLQPFVDYLHERIRKQSELTGLSLRVALINTTAVMAVDERLSYFHIQPVLYALAKARITHYGFETRKLRS